MISGGKLVLTTISLASEVPGTTQEGPSHTLKEG